MRTAMALGRDDGWTRRVVRMVGVSTAVHVGAVGGILLAGAWLATRRPAPIVAYSVELTDFPGTGGRLPTGPGNALIGRGPSPPAAVRSAAPPGPVAPPPKVVVPMPPNAVAPVAPKPAPAVAPAPPPKKAEAKVEPAKVEPKPAKVEPKKVEATKAATPKVTTATSPKPVGATPVEAKPAAGDPKSSGATATAPAPSDDYASAAQRFRDRMAVVGSGAGAPGAGAAGGGAGGVLGEGGDGRGGGKLVSLEMLAYKTQIVNAVKERWSNAISRPGMLAFVVCRIARDGTISNVRLSRTSGNPIYDQTAVTAVELVGQFPPPPPAHADKFAEFEFKFHGEEMGGAT
jgi:TonB family protein